MFFRPATLVVKNLLIINVLMYVATMVMGGTPSQMNPLGGGFYQIMAGHYFMSDLFRPWQVVTHMFMHGNLPHLFFNMFGVYIFGTYLEQYWGPKRFLIYYMLTGLGAFALHYLVMYLRIVQLGVDVDPTYLTEVYENGLNTILQGKEYAISGNSILSDKMNSINWLINGSVVGASGALFGLLIGFGLLFPNVRLMLLFPPIPIKARTLALGYGALELYLALQNPGDGVAHFAHLGGMLFGYIILKIWQKRGRIY